MPIINTVYPQSGTNTSDATATAAQILSPYTAYVASGKVTGTIQSQGAQTITPGTSNQTIASGKYLTGTQTILGDSNLSPNNIAKGISIFGVLGNARVVEYLFYSGGDIPINEAQTVFTLPGEWQNISANLHSSGVSVSVTSATMLVEQGYGSVISERLSSLISNSYSGGNTILTLSYPLSRLLDGALENVHFYVWKQ